MSLEYTIFRKHTLKILCNLITTRTTTTRRRTAFVANRNPLPGPKIKMQDNVVQ